MAAIDCGNSCLKIAEFNTQIIVRSTVITNNQLSEIVLQAELSRLKAAELPEICLASVVPGNTELVKAVAKKLGLALKIVDFRHSGLLPHRLSAPESTGIDRLLAARAGWEAAKPTNQLVVIQAGTAVTVDLVERGVLLGGAIIPGPRMWLDSLAGAAQIPGFSPDDCDWENWKIGGNTREAVMAGLQTGLPAAVEALVERMAKPEAMVVVTGGWGQILANHLKRKAVWQENLVLHGIRLACKSGYDPDLMA